MLALTMDNASVNNVMLDMITVLLKSRYNLDLDPQHTQGRCLAHVLNLVVQSILHSLNEADNPDIIDYYYSIHRKDPIHYEEDEEGVGGAGG